MKLLNDWIPEELLTALGWTLVHSFWQLIVVAAMLWVGLKLLKKSSPAMKYGLAVVTLVFSFVLTLGTFSHQWSKTDSSPGFSEAPVKFLLAKPDLLTQESNWETGIDQAAFWIENNLPLLVNFWFFGALLFLFRLLNNLSEIRGLRKSAQLVTDFEVQKMTYRLTGSMGISRDIELRMSEMALSPLTFGTIKPVILLPAALIFHLSPAQLEAIIAHELAHVKRNDYLINLLLSGLEILFFFHPCYWWMSQTVKELRENAADDLAIKAGIEPKHLAAGLAEILNFRKQNPPELALAAGKKRNPTLLRIKRMLGYKTENYPQTPIISLPMIFTLVLSLGLMASAQQDAPKPLLKTPESGGISSSFAPADTVVQKPLLPGEKQELLHSKKGEWIFSDGTKTYRISGDTLFSENEYVILSEKTKRAMEELNRGEFAAVPEFDIPDAPEFFSELSMPEFPEIEMEYPMLESPEFPDFPMEAFLPMPLMEPLEFPVGANGPFQYFYTDTVKAEREKWSKEMAEQSEKWAKIAEEKAAEWAKRSEEWAAKWEEGSAEREAKMQAWSKEFEPKMKEFELKMQEWQRANEPKMKEFELKMKAWQEAQEPKMKEFELKMKEWEATQKPKMEEFQRKMEVWQKEQQVKLQEFQKLLQEEFNKEKN